MRWLWLCLLVPVQEDKSLLRLGGHYLRTRPEELKPLFESNKQFNTNISCKWQKLNKMLVMLVKTFSLSSNPWGIPGLAWANPYRPGVNEFRTADLVAKPTSFADIEFGTHRTCSQRHLRPDERVMLVLQISSCPPVPLTFVFLLLHCFQKLFGF